jgi:hypothetical protein
MAPQPPPQIDCTSGITIGTQTFCNPLVGIGSINDLINRLLIFIVPFASIILLFVLIAGGFDILMSQGNPEKLKSGRAKITTGLIGFFLLVFAFVFVKLISFFLGVNSTASPF